MATASLTAQTPNASQADRSVAVYANEQQSLMEERQALVAAGATPEQLQAWYRKNSARIAAQRQRAQAAANVSAATIQKLPSLTATPRGATPEMTAFLTTRNALWREEVELHNQYANADAATKSAAMQKWRQQHAAQFAQLQQQAASLSQTTTLQENQKE